MSEVDKRSGEIISKKTTIFYSFAGIADTMSYQIFTFYIFNFYYTVVIGDIWLVTFGYILWSVWNAFNDPLLGVLSDRTSTRWGRRKPHIIAGIIPTCIILILLWTAPITNSPLIGFIYFIVIINLFDTFYTAYSLNQTSLFPEMYQDLDQRAKANNYVQIFNTIGLLFAALLPSLMVSELLGPETVNLAERIQLQTEFIIAAVVMSVLAAIFATIFILFGIRERKEYSKDPKKAPSFKRALNFTFKNKAFKTYVITNFAQWYVFGLIPIINPYFVKFILGEDSAFIASLFLAIIFISAICFMILWRNFFAKKGAKIGQMTALSVLILTMVPFTFVWEMIGAIITYIIVGFGFAGVLFGRDVVMSAIIDSDEIETGIRREAGYYGVNALIIRLSTVVVALTIAIVFPTVGWTTWDPTIDLTLVNIGIRVLFFVFPVIALGLGILSLSRFPITQEKYAEIKEKLVEIHSEKLKKISENR
jgi:GPH family glycoside/pentoside/hexuronide:cation symporter